MPSWLAVIPPDIQALDSIPEWMRQSHETAVSKGWWPEGVDRSLGEQLALWHSEISEALEEWRDGHDLTEIRYEKDTGKPVGFPIEVADLLIRVFDTCEKYGVDLETALMTKAAYNRTRPARHGGKLA